MDKSEKNDEGVKPQKMMPLKAEVTFKDNLNIVIEKNTDDSTIEERVLGMTKAGVDVFKWSVGTLLLALVGLFISYRHNKSEEYLAEYNADVKLITSIKLDTSLIEQYKNLYSIQPFILTDTIKRITQDRIDTIYKRLHSPVILAKYVSEKSATELGKDLKSPVATALKKLAVTDTTPNKQRPINELKAKENIIAGTSIPHPLDSVATRKMFETNVTGAIPSKPNYDIQGSPATLWCKQGYYIEFNSTLRIGIDHLDNSAQLITVNFKDIEKNPAEPILPDGKTNVQLKVNQTITLYNQDRNYQYQVALNYIGSAGKNPFTKAAYITVTTYKKVEAKS